MQVFCACMTEKKSDAIIWCKVRPTLCCKGYLFRCTHSSTINIRCIISRSFVFTIPLRGNHASRIFQPYRYYIKFIFLWIMHSVQNLISSVNGGVLKQNTGKSFKDKISYNGSLICMQVYVRSFHNLMQYDCLVSL